MTRESALERVESLMILNSLGHVVAAKTTRELKNNTEIAIRLNREALAALDIDLTRYDNEIEHATYHHSYEM